MNSAWTLLASGPVQLTPARSQMGFTLGFHILLVPLGVALPTLMLIANYKGLKRGDAAALSLARRWSHAAGLTFAVGAVTGTVLSFEFGLLWPGFVKTFGDVFGLPFAIEGISFFLEALLVAIYIYGWRRMKPWTHFWFGFPIPFVAIIGALSIISVNSWMNAPAGFTIGSDGRPTKVDPFNVIFNRALPWELTHFLIAAYMAATFMVASVYVVGWLRGRRDRYHRLGILIPFTIGAILAPIQALVGDQIARWVYQNQPAKFAAMEVVTNSGTHQPEYLFGIYHPSTNTVTGGIKIPGLDSWLAGGSTKTFVTGMNSIPPQNRASNPTLVHFAFDIMVGIGTLLPLVALYYAIAYWRRRNVPHGRIFLWVAAACGVLAYMAIEAGWITTEVGRQPWIVWNIARTSGAVTTAQSVTVTMIVIYVLYALLGIATIAVLRAMATRWRIKPVIDDDETSPYGPRPDAVAAMAGETAEAGALAGSSVDATAGSGSTSATDSAVDTATDSTAESRDRRPKS
ncbi:MAG TPA: cytochrome ubiquinol oxidase subunit I [Micromonosporaceae bacterium]|nr:cytochrome ubiquinol oxidase subunit I [Micromonosporaceae bacterium]